MHTQTHRQLGLGQKQQHSALARSSITSWHATSTKKDSVTQSKNEGQQKHNEWVYFEIQRQQKSTLHLEGKTLNRARNKTKRETAGQDENRGRMWGSIGECLWKVYALWSPLSLCNHGASMWNSTQSTSSTPGHANRMHLWPATQICPQAVSLRTPVLNI